MRLDHLLDKGYGLQEPTVWRTYTGGRLDRRQYVSASEVGNCERRIKFSKLADPNAPFTRWGFAERGHLIEEWAVNLVRLALRQEDDLQLVFSGKAQISFAEGDQSGTPDGVIASLNNSAAWVFDVKSIDPRTNWNYLPKSKHVDQVLQNMDLVGRATHYNVVGGILWYIDASDLQRRQQFDIEPDEGEYLRLRYRAEAIQDAKEPSDLEPEGLTMDRECDQCPFQEACSAIVASELKDHRSLDQLKRAAQDVFRS